MFNRSTIRTMSVAGTFALLLAGSGAALATDRLADADRSLAASYPDPRLLADGDLQPRDIEVDAEFVARLDELLLHSDARAAFYSDVADSVSCQWQRTEDPS